MTTDELKSRMIEAKKHVPKTYINVYEFMFGIKSIAERNKIRNVWNLRIVDEAIIKNFEKIVKKSK